MKRIILNLLLSLDMKITWVRHASIIIEAAGTVVYIDPYLDPFLHKNLPNADVVLISHPDYDHGTQQSVDLISTPQTKVFGTLTASEDINCEVVNTGDVLPGRTGTIAVVSAQSPADNVGYIIDMDRQRLYYPSDTAWVPEIGEHDCTLLFVPLGLDILPYQDVVSLIQAVRPRFVIPIHFGTLQGNVGDAHRLKSDVEDSTKTKVFILSQGGSVEL
jgi:L-ascorbate metabolism protein UlaG (beta-lactamase superfamily)